MNCSLSIRSGTRERGKKHRATSASRRRSFCIAYALLLHVLLLYIVCIASRLSSWVLLGEAWCCDRENSCAEIRKAVTNRHRYRIIASYCASRWSARTRNFANLIVLNAPTNTASVHTLSRVFVGRLRK